MACCVSLLLAAALTTGCLKSVSATRPALQLDEAMPLTGHLSVSGGSAHGAGARALLLPRTCGASGIIELEAGATYRTCPLHPDCTAQDVNHTVDASCRELRGAEGVRVEVSPEGIAFGGEATLLGPLVVTMAPSVTSLRKSAIRSEANITVSSETGPVTFRDIKGDRAVRGASVNSLASIELRGDNAITFSKVTAKRQAGALYAEEVRIFGGDVLFEYTQGAAAGAVCANKVHLKSDGNVTFRNSSASSWEAGALLARTQFKVEGKGHFAFINCTSFEGGALSIKSDAIFDLQPGGSVHFQHCIAGKDGAGGGAIAGYSNIHLVSGNFAFDGCLAGTGSAISAANGVVSITETANFSYTHVNHDDSGAESWIGKAIFAQTVVLPVGGNITEADVAALKVVLASKAPNQSDLVCPAGSRFLLDDHGNPLFGKCLYCPSGTVSLAPTQANVSGRISEVKPLMRLTLVSSGSANALHLPEQVALQFRFITLCAKSPEIAPCKQLGKVTTPTQPLTFREFPNASIVAWPLSPELCESLPHRDKFGCQAGLSLRWRLLAFGRKNETQGISYDGEHFWVNDTWMSVPYGSGRAGKVLYALDYHDLQPWGNASTSSMFEVDASGTIHPAFAPWMALGVQQEVSVSYDIPPMKTCVACHKIAPQGEVQCHGGTHLQLAPGFMLKHNWSQLDVLLYRCPNQLACPGGHFSLTAEGHPLPQRRSQICANAYDPSMQGCAQCVPGYGRSRLDPFKCEKCGDLTLSHRVATQLSTSALLYLMALRSAKPRRTELQQVFKIFLSFLTVSSRCLSAIKYARDYEDLRARFARLVQPLYDSVEMAGFYFSLGAGGGSDSVDCLGLVDGQADLALAITLDFFVPMLLLVGTLLLKAALNTGPPPGFKEVVVWGGVFLPVLFGSIAKSFPCVAMREGGEMLLVYELFQDTKCATSFMNWLALPRSWTAILLGSLLIASGPLLWLHLTTHPDEEKYQHCTSFLVAGYRPGVRWWETIVLVRKSAIFIIAVVIPPSWAPGAHIMTLQLTIILAGMLHAQIRPYEADRFNALESQVLGISASCLTVVALLIVPWPFVSPVVSLMTLLALVLLIFGAYVYLFTILASGFYYANFEEPAGGSRFAETREAIDREEDGDECMTCDDKMRGTQMQTTPAGQMEGVAG